MTTLTEFIGTVRDAALRGNALDNQIGVAIRSAVRFIEQNYNLPYMRRVVETTGFTGASWVLTGTDAARLKSIETIRWLKGSAYYYARQVASMELVTNDGEYPAGFELFQSTDSSGNATVTINFDTEFSEATDLSLFGFFYSVVDLNNPGDQSNWLINNAEQALRARTMINLAPVMREPQLMQMWQAVWMEEVHTLVLAADRFEQGAR